MFPRFYGPGPPRGGQDPLVLAIIDHPGPMSWRDVLEHPRGFGSIRRHDDLPGTYEIAPDRIDVRFLTLVRLPPVPDFVAADVAVVRPSENPLVAFELQRVAVGLSAKVLVR